MRIQKRNGQTAGKNPAIFIFLLILAVSRVSAQELTIPYVFTPGNVISSFEMNENFEALAEKASALDSVIGYISYPQFLEAAVNMKTQESVSDTMRGAGTKPAGISGLKTAWP